MGVTCCSHRALTLCAFLRRRLNLAKEVAEWGSGERGAPDLLPGSSLPTALPAEGAEPAEDGVVNARGGLGTRGRAFMQLPERYLLRAECAGRRWASDAEGGGAGVPLCVYAMPGEDPAAAIRDVEELLGSWVRCVPMVEVGRVVGARRNGRLADGLGLMAGRIGVGATMALLVLLVAIGLGIASRR